MKERASSTGALPASHVGRVSINGKDKIPASSSLDEEDLRSVLEPKGEEALADP